MVLKGIYKGGIGDVVIPGAGKEGWKCCRLSGRNTVTLVITLCAHNHEFSIASIVSANVMNRSIGIDIPVQEVNKARGIIFSCDLKKIAPKKRTTRLNLGATPTLATTTTTTSVTNAQVKAMIDQGVTAALAARNANTNGVDSHNSGTGARRNERAARECTYPDFMKFQPLNFKGIEGVVELTQ
ncbi:hypothetical protein Tco_0856308 [Tanacetum coccineum]|uniref:Uncharacterized protein n=1 Tax=Tanacetum coccineum TaxID=301880 RepID=A0ABQ5B3S0_9ASTR